MFLRDYLYVDTEKTRGFLAQIDEGVAESITSTARQTKSTEGGVKGFGSHRQDWGSDTQTSKSLGDALFSSLEEALDVNGLIDDLSDILTVPDSWLEPTRDAHIRPGALVRITAPGMLFDARYVAQIMGGFAAAFQGLRDMGIPIPGDTTSSQGGQSGKGQRPRQEPRPNRRPEPPAGERQLEDVVHDFAPMVGDDGNRITADYVRGIIKLSRGVFTPGIHVSMQPCSVKSFVVAARLQEGRAFLDSEPDILFARYGVTPQEFTLVGSIGSTAESKAIFDPSSSQVVNESVVNRAGTAAFINTFLQFIGQQGFADLPQYPGFSVVPLALYRTIGTPAETSLEQEEK